MRTTSASTLTLVSVEQRLNELARALELLVADVAKLRPPAPPSEPHNSQEELVVQLLSEGVIVKSSPEMLAIGAEWNADVAKLGHAKRCPKPLPTATPVQYEALITEQLAKGFLVEPSSETLAWIDELNTEWHALPEPEKGAIDEELRNLKLDLPLSEIIIKTRQGWYPDEAEVVE